MSLEVGDTAPGFTLPTDSWNTEVSLEDFTSRGPTVLFFYPGDWSSVCSDQLDIVEDHLPEFRERGVSAVGVSVDSAWSHAAFAHARELTIPLLSDFGREVSKSYGVLRDEGFSDRAYFILDANRNVLSRRIEASPGDQPDIQDVIEDLDRVL